VDGGDGALVGAGEEGEGMVVTAAGFGGDMDRDRGTVAAQRQGGGGLAGLVMGCWGWRGGDLRFEIRDLELVGLVGVEGSGGSEAAGAEEGIEAREGVGELVGVAKGTVEEAGLGLGGEGGGEGQGPCHDGRRRGDGVEVGLEETQEGEGVAGGFGEAEVAEVEVAVVEGEGEAGRGGGAPGGGEAGAERVEAAAEEEEKRFKGVERVVEVAGGPVVLRRAVEAEEAEVFAVEDVVEAGGVRTETLREPLAGEGGEIAEGGEAPERQQV